MIAITEYLLSKSNARTSDEDELQHMLNTEEDGMKIINSKQYTEYLKDRRWEVSLVPVFVKRNTKYDLMTGDLWAIYNAQPDEEDDPDGKVLPYYDLCKKCLWDDAKKAYTGKLKRRIDKALDIIDLE